MPLNAFYGGGITRVAGTSAAMWLHNAEYIAKEQFGDETSIFLLRKKYSITRPQDLIGGKAAFGFLLPTRDYIVDDTIPGVGRIDEIHGDQYRIASNWFHKKCFDR